MKPTRFLQMIAGALWATIALTSPARAAVPTTTTAEGLLSSTGGGAVADGNYSITFKIYQDAQGGQPVWSEGPLQVVVKNGAFSQPLGVTAPLSPSITAAAGYLALQIAAEPELARKPLRAVVFSQRAAIAEALACSGCVTAGMLEAGVLQGVAKTADLAGYVKTSELAGYVKAADLSEYVKASALAKVAGTGQYGDLQGLPVLAKVGTACGSGLFVQGIKADGSLECAAPVFKGGKCDVGQVVSEVKADGSVVCGAVQVNLPPDGLAAVSNGLLTNVFDEVYASTTTPKSIPDNNPSGVLDEIVVPDSGTVKEISVSIDIQGQTTGSLVVTLFDPNNDTYVLHSKKDVGASLMTTYPTLTKTVSGDLTTWVGKNPKGTWRLVVADWAGGGSVGTIKGWSVNSKVLSTGKVSLGSGEIRPVTRLALTMTPGVPVTLDGLGSGTIALDAWVKDSNATTIRPAIPADSQELWGSGKDGVLIVKSPTTLTAGRYDFERLEVATGGILTFIGTDPVEIHSASQVLVYGIITVSGSPGEDNRLTSTGLGYPKGGAAGPGGWAGGQQGSGSGPGGGLMGKFDYCDSGSGAGGVYKGPNGGVASGELVGGSGGGYGGFGNCGKDASYGAGGGGGGGIIKVLAPHIRISGKVLSEGGPGGSAVSGVQSSTAGGGGSGGAIWLVSQRVDVTAGTLSAIGGVGGASTAKPGGNGGQGVVRVDAGAFVAGAGAPSAIFAKTFLRPAYLAFQPTAGTLVFWPFGDAERQWYLTITH